MEEKTYQIIRSGIIFEMTTGFAISLILIFMSNFIATTIFNRPESAILIAIASTTVFVGGFQMAAQSAFLGFERMKLNSLTNVLQATAKSIAAPLLVLIGCLLYTSPSPRDRG